jgi:hypothetical protein
MDWIHLAQWLRIGSLVNSNDPYGSLKIWEFWEFLDQLNDLASQEGLGSVVKKMFV